MSNRTQLPGWLRRAGLVMLAFVATSCGDDNPSNPPTTGSIAVTAATAGDEIDTDGYTVTVDDLAGRPIAVDGTETFTNLSAGTHTVTLTGVAANCTVAGDNPRDVTVTAGSTASTTFDVTCSATAGAIGVTTASTGDDVDTDGYTVSVDGGPAQNIDANGTLTVSGLDAGDHSVELGDVADNCTVAGDNPRTVAVTAGATATTQFDVACTTIPGDLKIVNATTGDNLDDQYTVTVDGGLLPDVMLANDSLAVQGLTAGDHTVELGDVAANCTVAGDNPRTVTVTSGGEVTTQFDVACILPPSGGLNVATNTWGLSLDGSGYGVSVDGGAVEPIAINATLNLDLDPGDHTVELSNIAANCTVQNDTNPRTVTVVDGADTDTQFDLFCWENLDRDVMFETDRDGNREIYVREQGGPLTNMTNNAAEDRNPSVATDGSAVVFESDRDGSTQIWKMNVGGFTKLTPGGNEFDPDFGGPAGSLLIGFVRGDQIWTMNVAGANRTAVSTSAGNDSQPDVSPDGNWILFASTRDGNEEIYVVNVASGVETRLTNDANVDGKPAWWFDGSKVLWVSDRTGDFEVYVADFDAVTPALGVETNLSNDASQNDLMPAMRPDATSIAFVRDGSGTLDIWTMDPDGTNKSSLFGATSSNDRNPAWSP